MKKAIVMMSMLWAAVAHAGLAEVVAAQAAADAAKDQVKAMKKSLTKVEKAELAVAVATAKLAKVKAQ